MQGEWVGACDFCGGGGGGRSYDHCEGDEVCDYCGGEAL